MKSAGFLFFGTDGTGILDGKRYPGVGDRLFSECIIAVKPGYRRVCMALRDNPNELHGIQCECAHHGCRSHHCGTETARGDGGPKNGFFYVLEAGTGKLLFCQNPLPRLHGQHPSTWKRVAQWKLPQHLKESQGERVPALPTGLGAHNWHAQSYSPLTGLVLYPGS